MNVPVLEVRNLVKHFGRVEAVRGIDFAIQPGTCFGLLGPNGAGKTTTIEVIEGILSPTSGEILYKGRPRGRAFREEVGIQLQSTELLVLQTVRETLEVFRNLYRRTMPAYPAVRSNGCFWPWPLPMIRTLFFWMSPQRGWIPRQDVISGKLWGGSSAWEKPWYSPPIIWKKRKSSVMRLPLWTQAVSLPWVAPGIFWRPTEMER
jgi:hypothetical protein